MTKQLRSLTPPEKPTEGLPTDVPATATKSTATNEETSGPDQRRGQETRAERSDSPSENSNFKSHISNPKPDPRGERGPAKAEVHLPFAAESVADRHVLNVVVEGNSVVNANEILKLVKIPLGEPTNEAAIRTATRAIFATQRFYSVEPRYRVDENGVVIVFRVIERPPHSVTLANGVRVELLGVSNLPSQSVNVDYAKATLEVAKKELAKLFESNRKVPQSVPASEIKRLELIVERAEAALQLAEAGASPSVELQVKWAKACHAVARAEVARMRDANRRVPNTVPEPAIEKAESLVRHYDNLVMSIEDGSTRVNLSHEQDLRGWWSANGSSLPTSPLTVRSLQDVVPAGTEKDSRAFALKVSTIGEEPSVSVRYEPAVPNTALVTIWQPRAAGSNEPRQAIVELMAGPWPEQKTVKLIAHIAMGKWQGPWAFAMEQKGLETIRGVRAEVLALVKQIAPQQLEVDQGNGVLICWPKLPADIADRADVRIVAIDKRGIEHSLTGTKARRNPETGRVEQGTYFKLAKADIDHFAFGLRPFEETVTFENVSLEPGHTTQSHVSSRNPAASVKLALSGPTELNFADSPFIDVLTFLRDYHNIPIHVDSTAYARRENLDDVPITLTITGQTLANALSKLLDPLQLSYYVESDRLIIATPEEVKRRGHALSATSSAEREPAKRDSVRERLRNRITLHLENVPLPQAIEHIGRAAKIAVRLDSDALENEGIGADDTPVSLSVDRISTASALQLLLQPFQLGYLIENETLVVTTPARLAKTPVEEQLDLGKTLADEAKMRVLRDAIHTFVQPKSWDVAGGPGSIRFNASREEFVVRHVPFIQHEVNRFLRPVVSSPISPELQRLRKLLSQRFTLESGEVTLVDAVRKIATTADANVLLDVGALLAAGVRSDRRVTLNHKDTPLRDILNGLCKPLKLRFRIWDEVIHISDEETAQGGFFPVLYPVIPSANDLSNRIQSIRPESWKFAGGQGTIESHLATNSLIIRQHDDVHDEIEQLYAKLVLEVGAATPPEWPPAGTGNGTFGPAVKPAAQLKGQIRWIEKSKGLVWINLGHADGIARPMRFQVREQEDPKNGNRPQAVKGKIEVLRVIDAHTSEARIVEEQDNLAMAKGDEIVRLFEATQPNDKPVDEQRKLPPPKGEFYDARDSGTDRIKPKQGSGTASGAISGIRRERDPKMPDQFTGRVRLKTEKPLPDLEKVVVPAGKRLDESLVFSKDGGLANVFVYLRKPTFKIDELAIGERVSPSYLIAGDGKFSPHAAIVRVGSPLTLLNSGPEAVDFHARPLRSDGFDVTVAKDHQFEIAPFKRSESVPFSVKCNFTPWLLAHVLTLDHPFASVTDQDGNFRINGLPPGEHEFRVWHERAGDLEKSLVVTIKPGEKSRSDLDYEPTRFKLDEAEVQNWGSRQIKTARGAGLPNDTQATSTKSTDANEETSGPTQRRGQETRAESEKENTDTEWSQEQNGLRTRLTLLSEEPFIGRLVVKIAVENVGATGRAWRWHPREAARYFRIIGPDGKDVEDLTEVARSQMGRPNVARPTQIKPGETKVLLEFYDLAGRFLLAKPGQYEIRFGRAVDGELAGKFKNDGADIVPIPESSRLKFQLSEGELPEIQSLALRLRKVLPIGFGVGLPDPDEFQSSRTDSADSGLLFDPPDHGKKGMFAVLGFFGEGKAPPKLDDKDLTPDDLGPTKLGHAFLIANKQVKIAWPNYLEQIRAQLPQEDKAETGKAATNAPPKPAIPIRKPSDAVGKFVGRVRLKTEKPLPDLEKVVVAAGKVLDESLVFSKEGGLANVFVYLPKLTFPIEPPPSDKPPKPFVLIAEDGKFWPHAAFVRVGRPIVFENRQTEPVNFRLAPLKNVSFNVLVQTQDHVKIQAFRYSESFPFTVKSDIQPWMVSHVLTLDHPFAAVTDDEGRFTIDGLPPGDHEFRVWHERVGYLEKKLLVTLKPGEDARLELEYKPEQLKLDEATVQAWGDRLIDAARNLQPRAIRLLPPPKVDDDAKPDPSKGAAGSAQRGAPNSALKANDGLTKQDDRDQKAEISDLKSQISNPKPDTVKTAINRGIAFLKSRQTDSGLWPEQLAPIYDGGVSSLCVLALLQAGAKPDEEIMQKALVALRKIKPDKTYTVALQTMVFCAAASKEDTELIRRSVAWIEKAQVTEGASRGGWGYQANRLGNDGSNSRFAVMGLHAAKKAGFDVQDETWRRVSEHYMKTQTDQGGWGYSSPANQSLSMTLAGLGSLATANRYLPNDDQTKAREAAMLKPIAYLEKAIPTLPNASPTFYTFHCLERAGHISGIKEFGKLDWNADLIKRLLETQQPNGSWNGKGVGETDIIATSLALLALTGQPESKLVGYRLRFEPRDADKPFQMLSSLDQNSSPPMQRTVISGGVRIEFRKPDGLKCRIEADRAIIESDARAYFELEMNPESDVMRIECIGSVKCEDRRGAESTQLTGERLWFDVRKNHIRTESVGIQR